MKNYFVASLLLSLCSILQAETTAQSDMASQEIELQVLSRLAQLAKQETRLIASQQSVLRVIHRERAEERRSCLEKWKDSSFAKVWPISSWGKNDGREWNELKPEEKAFFKHLCVEKYIDKKLPELSLPKLRISEDEYSTAWEIIHSFVTGATNWSKISDFTLKSRFRKEYHDYKVSLVSGSSFPMLVQEEPAMLLALQIMTPLRTVL
jgi:hypothetical protein